MVVAQDGSEWQTPHFQILANLRRERLLKVMFRLRLAGIVRAIATDS